MSLSQLHDLSERWFAAWLQKDASTVEHLMANDYVYVGLSGLTLDRQAILAVIRSPSYRLDHGARSEVVVRLLGARAALVRHRYQGSGSFKNRLAKLEKLVAEMVANCPGCRLITSILVTPGGKLPEPGAKTVRCERCGPIHERMVIRFVTPGSNEAFRARD